MTVRPRSRLSLLRSRRRGVSVAAATVARPSLDDVYLRYAGRAFAEADREREEARWRQPWWVAISLAQPLVYLLLFSALFERIAEIPGFRSGSYLDFIVPGIVLMTAMFSGGWAGIGLINDLDGGVIDRFLVSPVSRTALIAGRLMQQAIVTVIQSAIIIALGFAIGARFPRGAGGVAV
jgi:ABC-2 type transport system permease protein